ncbi:MAG: ABC transporter permease [Fulvimarina manganoxydans]|uniref:ABC transporter permease n=1 Tax=Fulvimarina manganoxydans TaxID=937218 RepID=UPI00235680A9|nr:ABC transporter permease [Fulvimarina manganoxydans]MCK5932963.1 ABC transporter permease [Fulvimarina manganoxydans]
MMGAEANEYEVPAETMRERAIRLLGGGWIFLLLIALIALFVVLKPTQFGSSYNLSQIAINAAILLVLAVGQTYVIIAAGIDLSVGSVLVFASVVSAKLMLVLSGDPGTTYGTTDAGWGIIALGTLAALAAGCLWGAINGFLVAVARIPPLIVTLGTLGMALGFSQLLTGGVDVRAMPERLVASVGSGDILGIPSLVAIAGLVAVLAGLVLHLTRFGTHVYALGSNEEAARRSGIDVRRRLIAVYAISGTLAGVAAVMSNARFATTTIGGHTMDNLTTISAVVLGGTSLFGGLGSVFGTVVGVFIPIILLNGFVILGIPPFWQTVAMGAVLILAVWIDQLKRRLRARS